MQINFKTYYVGFDQGEIVCNQCAGNQLRSAIVRDPKATGWQGAQDFYAVAGIDLITEMREEFGAVCNCEMPN